ncbi:hypothetical protein K488DRAFT_46332 [Vararia minispora EC-137]|uniref:Uncharacterized protein n=1 Tax=Vararia minispora EC-137 TaxID=1314806 RepID=A0ACB8QR55_9AGAM|nr:hypothetical protein K488DRAFT_46332 [Vararia minispora EC-137]
MDSGGFIDIQFDRAVEIVQNLPKTGPIQTGYEEKLTILYKQATVGNVKGSRPGMWEVLNRAKWDAWAKHKDLDSYEAKWLYVEALFKVLRRYSDATVARDLVRELESYRDDSSNILAISTYCSQSRGAHSDSSSEDGLGSSAYRSAQLKPHPSHMQHTTITAASEDETSEDEEPQRLPAPPVRDVRVCSPPSQNYQYHTPLNASHTVSPSLVPSAQPRGISTPSAFGPSLESVHPAASSLYGSSGLHGAHPTSVHSSTFSPSSPTLYRSPPSRPSDSLTPRSPSTFAFERTIEAMQAHIAALSERIDSLEAYALRSSGGYPPGAQYGSPTSGGPLAARSLNDFGLWSYALQAIMRMLRGFASLARMDGRSPGFIIIRRLFLDLSFILVVLALVRTAWRRTGVRRREIMHALRALGRAIAGSGPPRTLVSRGV